MVDHHVQRGRRRLALILPDADHGSSAVLRREGFLRAVRRRGVDFRLVSGDWSYGSGKRAMRQMWSEDVRPDAVLAGNDRMAAGALRAAHELGLQVPRDLAISGFDEFEFARYTTPSLTTVHIPHAEMAEQAAAQRATGYVVGGISPLGQKRELRTVIDESALIHKTVLVSGGRRGLDVELSPADLVALTSATTALIGRP